MDEKHLEYEETPSVLPETPPTADAVSIEPDAVPIEPDAVSAEPDAVSAEPDAPAPKRAVLSCIYDAVAGFFCDYSWIALLAAAVLIVAYYVLFPSRTYFHADTTDTLMWAQASYDAGSLFNPEFHYACFLPFNTSLLMTALIPLFGVSMTTHVLGMLGFFLLFTAAFIFCARGMNWSWKWISLCVFVQLMVLSGSEKLREIFWGHTIYYSIGVLCLFVGLGLAFRFMRSNAEKPNMRKMCLFMVLIGVWFFFGGMNQLNGLTIFALPLLAAVFLERFLDTGDSLFCKENRRTLLLLMVMAVCMVLGYLLTSMLTKGMTADYASAYSTYSDISEWMDNLKKFPMHWLTLLGVDVGIADNFMSMKSIGNLVIVLNGIILLVLPLIGLCNYARIEDKKLRLLLLTYWCMLLLIMFGYVCGLLSSANWRLSPIVAMATLTSLGVVRWAAGRVELSRLAIMAMIPVVIGCMVNATTILHMPADGHKETMLYRLADELEKSGLTYGYATFWNANSITVISDSAVKCRNVIVDGEGVREYDYQGCDSWYYDQLGQENYFLLLTEDEYYDLTQSNALILQNPHVERVFEYYHILVFEENLFTHEEFPENLAEEIEQLQDVAA